MIRKAISGKKERHFTSVEDLASGNWSHSTRNIIFSIIGRHFQSIVLLLFFLITISAPGCGIMEGGNPEDPKKPENPEPVYVLITSGPPPITNIRSAHFTFECSRGSCDFQCAHNVFTWSDCTSPYSLHDLDEGGHAFFIRASVPEHFPESDSGQTAIFLWTVDTEPPLVKNLEGPPDPSSGFVSFSFDCSKNDCIFFCSLEDVNGLIVHDESPCESGIEYQNLPEKQYRFKIHAKDQAGNTGPKEEWSWYVSEDWVPPDDDETDENGDQNSDEPCENDECDDEIIPAPEIHSFSPDMHSPQSLSVRVQWTLGATGVEPLEYAFEILEQNSVVAARRYMNINTVPFSAPGQGTYTVRARVRDPDGRISEALSDPFTFNGTAEGTLILGPTIASIEAARSWAEAHNAHSRFIDIAEVYWLYGELTGIRADVLYAQSALETGFGNYGGAVRPDQNNWAGIKIGAPQGDRPEDHESFSSPEEGVRAHFNHISAYVGVEPVGEPHARYYVVLSMPWAGTVKYVEEFGGRWAPASDYGSRIVTNYLNRMLER